MSLASQFIALDDALSALDVPPCTGPWRDGICSFLDAYEAGNALEFWVAAGRGSSKSNQIAKLAVFFSLFVPVDVPIGERHHAIILSRLKEEASKTVSIVDRWLTLLGVPHKLAGDVIELDAIPVGIRVCAASVAAASGWRAFFVGCDEFAKWSTGSNEGLNAGEVRSSAVAMTATHPRAPIVTMSSAWGASGEFFDAVTEGTTAAKVVLGPVATWEIAPHITEEQCRAKERDERRFQREFACSFQAGAASAFDPEDIRACINAAVPDGARGETVVLIDPSSGGGDTFSYCLANWIVPKVARFETDSIWDRSSGRYLDVPRSDASGNRIPIEVKEEENFRPVLQLHHMGGFAGAFRGKLSGDVIMDAIVKLGRTHGARWILSDQFEQLGLTALALARGMNFKSLSWSQTSKQTAAERLRFFFRERRIALPENPTLAKQLVDFEEKISPSGSLTFSGKRGGHDDLAMLALLAARADADGLLSGSPSHARRSGVITFPDGSTMPRGRDLRGFIG